MSTNSELFERAKVSIPGGVNSPVRAFGPVGGTPPFIASGIGCRVTDAEGRTFIDYVGSWGPLILGHAHPEVLEAVQRTASAGTSFGAPTEREIELAETIARLVPSAEKVRLVSSGTEATMTALRLARGITGRDRVVKFEGCYHGHADSFLVAAGSGAASHGHPSSPGVPKALAELTLVAPYNDIAATEALFEEHGDDIAAVIVEPIAGNMGLVEPTVEFRTRLRELTSQHGGLLIYDEVMTGFRVHPDSAQGLYGIEPDLTTLGKIVGGGLPVGAIAGPSQHLDQLSPEGPVYQAGTLSGNPLSVAAGLAMLRILERDRETIYARLAEATGQLVSGLSAALTSAGIAHQIPHVGSMFCVYFSDRPVRNFTDAADCDRQRFNTFFHQLLEGGVSIAPSPFEAGFLSLAHDDDVIAETIAVAERIDWNAE